MLRFAEGFLHIGGCVVLLYGVVVTVFITAVLAEARPAGFDPIEYGLTVAATFSGVGGALLLASRALRKYLLSESQTCKGRL